AIDQLADRFRLIACGCKLRYQLKVFTHTYLLYHLVCLGYNGIMRGSPQKFERYPIADLDGAMICSASSIPTNLTLASH
ncbi:MAG: hypothetical protein ACRC9W_07690, partial [Plesiomonas sp.]